MLAFILRRLAQAIIVMLAVAFIAFMLFQYVGDPVTNLLGQDATPEQRQPVAQPISAWTSRSPCSSRPSSATRCSGEFGLSSAPGAQGLVADRRALSGHARTRDHRGGDRTAWSASRWASTRRCKRGNFFSQAADDVLAARGVAADVPDRHPADPAVRGGASRCCPASGEAMSSRSGAWTTGLPDGSKGGGISSCRRSPSRIFQLTLIMRLVRAEMLEVLRTDYIKFARARGLTEPQPSTSATR